MRKVNGCKAWKRVADGIWRNLASGTLYERPKLGLSWTFRSLYTNTVKSARAELARRISARRFPVATATPAANPIAEIKPASVTVSQIVRRYQQDGYPDRHKQARQGSTLKSEQRHCLSLIEFWDKLPVEELSLVECDRYHQWRKENVKNGGGDRTVDMELCTLSNTLLWAMRCGLIQKNPLDFRRPRYHATKNVRHCREYMPFAAEELHAAAQHLFSNLRCGSLGWQLLFEAFTGLRTCEALQLRTDAGSYEPGWITADGKSLCVRRAKGQESVNPFVRIHEGLAAWLKAHQEWKQDRYPDSPWFFPSYRNPDTNHIDKNALTHSLRRLQKEIGRKITSHGMRAFYVTVRRSHGIPDNQIAWEIGHTSAGKTLASVYGGVPPHWLADEGPKLTWLPTAHQPAWEAIPKKPEQAP